MAENDRWTHLLEEEDLAFLKRFVLASGSLKELAEVYGISYPTVRLRLDRLIAKIKIYDSHQKMTEFERMARGLLADGLIDQATLKNLLAAHKRDLESNHEKVLANRAAGNGK